MYICYGNTIWGFLFFIIEIMSLAILTYLYTKFTMKIRKNNEIHNYEKLDLIIIFLSIFQVYLMLFSLVVSNNFGFSILQEISKFTQNMIICGCLLFQIFLWQKYPIAIYIIKNYVYIFTCFNFFILICGFFFEYSFLEVNFCFSVILKILPVLGFIFNLLLISMALYNNYQEQNESRKKGVLIYENDNLGAIIDKYASSLQKMRKYYLIFIIYFTVSYFVDVYFKFSNIRYDDNITNASNGNKKNNVINNTVTYYRLNKFPTTEQNLTDFYQERNKYNINNFLDISVDNNITKHLLEENYLTHSNDKKYSKKLVEKNEKVKNIESIIENEIFTKRKKIFIMRYISACEYYKDLGDKYNFKELLVCFISFVFRDIGPHIYIFISLFLYKPETLSRSSSFIEI